MERNRVGISRERISLRVRSLNIVVALSTDPSKEIEFESSQVWLTKVTCLVCGRDYLNNIINLTVEDAAWDTCKQEIENGKTSVNPRRAHGVRVNANVLYTDRKLTERMIGEIREALAENYGVDSGVELPLNKTTKALVFYKQYYPQGEVSD